MERFHQSLRKEFLATASFTTLEEAQTKLSAWVNEYNTERPHQSLEMAVPAERFGLTRLAKDEVSVQIEEEEHGQWVQRRVGSNGIVSVDNQLFSAGNAFKHQLVDVFVDDTVIQVWSKNHLIKTVARARQGPVRKVRSDGLGVKDQLDTMRKASGGI